MSNDLVQFVQNQESMFLEQISDEKVTFAAESQFAIQALQGNSYLAGLAKKNMASLQNAIINVASIGISLNPANKYAYLVPRDGKVCLDVSYMGLLHLAMSTGSIKWGQCKLVHQNDEYESNGLDNAPTHKYNPFSDRGSIIGGYCTVKTADGDYLTEEMPLSDIVAIQNSSSAKNGPWKTHFSEMARKTIVKRASKYWPKVERLDAAIHHLNTDGGEGLQQEPQQQRDITPCSAEQLNKISSELKRLDKSEEDAIEVCPKLINREILELPDLTGDEAVKLISFLEAR